MFLSVQFYSVYELNTEKKHLDDNKIDSLMQWLQFQDTRKPQWIIPIYIKVFYDENMSYLTVSTDNVLNATNNDTPLTELRRVF